MRPQCTQAVALLGSLLMPHNLYLHSALVKSRRLRAQDDGHRREALAYFGLESALSLLVRWGCAGVALGCWGRVVVLAGVWLFWRARGTGGGLLFAGEKEHAAEQQPPSAMNLDVSIPSPTPPPPTPHPRQVSIVINTCVVCVFAAGYYKKEGVAVDDIGLENAGTYLGQTYGAGIVYIWVSRGFGGGRVFPGWVEARGVVPRQRGCVSRHCVHMGEQGGELGLWFFFTGGCGRTREGKWVAFSGRLWVGWLVFWVELRVVCKGGVEGSRASLLLIQSFRTSSARRHLCYQPTSQPTNPPHCTPTTTRTRRRQALGLLAAGQSSTMTGCYTGQFVMEGFLNFKVGVLRG